MAHFYFQDGNDAANDDFVEGYVHTLLAQTNNLIEKDLKRPYVKEIIERQRELLKEYGQSRYQQSVLSSITKTGGANPEQETSDGFIMVEPRDLSLSDVSIQVPLCDSFDKRPNNLPKALSKNPKKYIVQDHLSEEKDLSSKHKKRLIRRSHASMDISSSPDLIQDLVAPRQDYEADTESAEELNRNPSLRLSSSLTHFFEEGMEQQDDRAESPEDQQMLSQTESFPSATDFLREKAIGNRVFLASPTSGHNSAKADKSKVSKGQNNKIGVAFEEPNTEYGSRNIPKSSVLENSLQTPENKKDKPCLHSDDCIVDPTNPFSPVYQEGDTGAMEMSETESSSQLHLAPKTHNNRGQKAGFGLLGGAQNDCSPRAPFVTMPTNSVATSTGPNSVQEMLRKVQILERNYKYIVDALKKKRCLGEETEVGALARRAERLLEERNRVQEVAERHLRKSAVVQSRMRKEMGQLSEDFTRAVAAKLEKDGHLESRVVQQLLTAQEDRDKYLIAVLERQNKINELALLVRSQQLYIRDLEDRLSRQCLHESLAASKPKPGESWDEDGDLNMDTRSSSYSDVIDCDHGEFLPGTSTNGDNAILDLFGYSDLNSPSMTGCLFDVEEADPFNPLALGFVQRQLQASRDLSCQLREVTTGSSSSQPPDTALSNQ